MKSLGRTVALLATLGGAVLSGQTPAPAQEQQQPVFRAGVELVRLDVRIVDDQGRPVQGLGPQDVVVEEAGQRRPVVLFQHVIEPSGSYVETARRTIGAEVSTNQGAPRGHLYVFVFDQQHISPGNEQRARAAVERFLRTRVRPGDRVALYAIPGPGPQLPLSPNTQLALAELPKIRGSLDRDISIGAAPMSQFEAYQISRGDQGLAQRVLMRGAENAGALDVQARQGAARASASGAPGGALGAGESYTTALQMVVDAARSTVVRADAETRAFLMSLSDIIRQLATIEGRKSILLVSEGFYADNVARDVDGIAAAAAEAYAVIYSLDINRRGSDPAAPQPTGGEGATEIQSRLESLGALAAETSGELVIDANTRMDAVVSEIADASQDYYIVGFEPPSAALADRHSYRRVKVSVNRPGVRVTARTGYSLRDPVGLADRRRSIDSALAAPFSQQGLPLEMTTYVLHGLSPGSQRVFLSLRADMPVAAKGQPRLADVVFVVRNANDGRVMASGTDVMPLPAATTPGRTSAPGNFNVQFDLPAGDYLMRAVVREPGGTTGTVDRRFEVRALDGVDITASDLIIGARQDRLPVRPAAYVDEGLVGALEVYARNPADLSGADVGLDLFRVDGESPVRSVKAELSATKAISGGGVRSARVEMPLSGVAPGDYVARATVRAHGETVTELVRQLEVVAGRAPAAPAGAVVPERVSPDMIAGGELGRRFVNGLREKAGTASLQQAADQAALGSWDKALALLPAEAAGEPPTASALRGLANFALGRMDAASVSMERAWSLDSRSPLTAFFLGWIRAARGQSTDAVSAWRSAVALDSHLISGYLALADIYVKLAHPELAVQALEEGLRANPDSPELTARLDAMGRKQ